MIVFVLGMLLLVPIVLAVELLRWQLRPEARRLRRIEQIKQGKR